MVPFGARLTCSCCDRKIGVYETRMGTVRARGHKAGAKRCLGSDKPPRPW